MNATTTTCQQNAIDRSRELDSDLMRTSRIAPGRYQVLGQSNWYEIVVSPAGYSCTCTAGQHGKPCWHAASCYRLRLACRALKGGQVVRSAHIPAPEPKVSAREELWG